MPNEFVKIQHACDMNPNEPAVELIIDARKDSLSSRVKPCRESRLVTKFPISREDRLPFDGLPRSLHLRIISHAAHAAIGRESFRNATNAMTPLRRIDMLARARARRSFGTISDAGQRVVSQAHNTHRR